MQIRHKETGAILAEMPDNSITGADLSGRDLRGADLRGLTVVATAFREANLSHADMAGATFIGCDLPGADMSEVCGADARLINTVLRGANLTSASLPRLRVERVKRPFLNDVVVLLYGAGFLLTLMAPAAEGRGALPRGREMWVLVALLPLYLWALAYSAWQAWKWRRLPGWWNPLLWRRLYRAPDMSRANLRGACLKEAQMAGVEMERATFSGADLAGADLTDANLTRADFAGADLHGATLVGALLIHANTAGATYDATTHWPATLRNSHPGLHAAMR